MDEIITQYFIHLVRKRWNSEIPDHQGGLLKEMFDQLPLHKKAVAVPRGDKNSPTNNWISKWPFKLVFGIGLILVFFAQANAQGNINGTPPTITKHPASVTEDELASTTFSVEATGDQGLRYEWRRNGIVMIDAIGAQYEYGPIKAEDNGAIFDVTVFKDAFGARSNPATLTVRPKECPIPQEIEIELNSVGLGLGWSWGRGILTFTKVKDQVQVKTEHYFSVSGLNLGSVGIANSSIHGTVCNLNKAPDLSGTYWGWGGNLALAGGIGGWGLQNHKSVRLSLDESLRGIHVGGISRSLVLQIH